MCKHYLGAIVSKSQLSWLCIAEIYQHYIDLIDSLPLDDKLKKYVEIKYMDSISSQKQHFYYVYIPEQLKNSVKKEELRQVGESIKYECFCDDFSWYRE